MEGREGPPKKSIGQRLAQIYFRFVPGGEGPLANEVEEVEENERGIKLGDVAWAIDVLNAKWPFVNNGKILTTLGVGDSEKIDYFKTNPDEYREVNRVLQQLVDEKVLYRNSYQDRESKETRVSYMVENQVRLHELAESKS